MLIRGVRWDEWNLEHIARHGVEPEEVEAIVYSQDFTVRRVGDVRYLLTGQPDGGRYLSVVLDREQPGRYFVVTARDATASERRDYQRHRRGR